MWLWLIVNGCCDGCSESDIIHQAVINPSQSASTQHCLAQQPNIDLQVTLTQRWPGLNALLIDVAPYCLLVNECDLELTLVEENGGSWRLPAGKTFSPPFFHEVSFFSIFTFLRNVILPLCAPMFFVVTGRGSGRQNFVLQQFPNAQIWEVSV